MANRVIDAPTFANTAGTYAVGDLIGTKLVFTHTTRQGKGGAVKSVVVGDGLQKNIPLSLVLFDSDPSTTTFTDKSGLQISDADRKKVVGIVEIGTANYKNFGTVNRSNGYVDGKNIPYGSLYGALLAGATVAFSGTAVYNVRLGVESD